MSQGQEHQERENDAGDAGINSNGNAGTNGDGNTGANNAVKPRLKSGHILALLILAALAIRVLAALTRPMIQLDETAYVRMAENLAAGNSPLDISGLTATHFSPLLPLLIAGVAFIVRNYILAAYIVVTVFGSLILLPTYLLGKELVNRKVGLMAAALMAVTPLFVDYSSRIYSESVYIFFLLLAIVFGRHMIMGCRIPCGTLAGASLGMAYLANPSAVFYLVALVSLAVVVGFVRGIGRRMARSLVFFLVFFLLYATPYVLFLHAETGMWTYSGKSAGNIYASTHSLRVNTMAWEKDLMSLSDDNQEVRALTVNDQDPATFVLEKPLQAARILARQSQIFYAEELPRVFPLWLLPLLGLGLFARGWSRRRLAAIGYLLLMMAPALLILTMYVHSRFFMPFVPLAMIWAAEGWGRLEVWGAETIPMVFSRRLQPRLEKWAPWVIGAVVLLPLLAYAGATVLKQNYPLGYRDAGRRIKQEAGEGKMVMSREFSAAYYSGGTAVMLPYADYGRTTEYARAKGIDFLVIGRQELADWRPGLACLADEGFSHPEWRLIDSTRPGTDQETLIFKLEK